MGRFDYAQRDSWATDDTERTDGHGFLYCGEWNTDYTDFTDLHRLDIAVVSGAYRTIGTKSFGVELIGRERLWWVEKMW